MEVSIIVPTLGKHKNLLESVIDTFPSFCEEIEIILSFDGEKDLLTSDLKRKIRDARRLVSVRAIYSVRSTPSALDRAGIML